jgi:hypothetical protein
MLYAEKTPTCPNGATEFASTAEGYEAHTGPRFQLGSRRFPTCGRAHKGEGCRVTAGMKTWIISEDELGFIRSNGDALHDIVSVFGHSGTLLAEAGTAERQSVLADRSRGCGRLGRLLRYYFGEHGERRVEVLDGGGSHWPARIVGTRWHPKGRVWLISIAVGERPRAVQAAGA